MRRRVDPKVTEAAQSKVPAEIAEGPRVSRWAHPRTLEILAEIPDGSSEERRTARDHAMLSAFSRYRFAAWEWENDAGLPRHQSRRLLRSCMPYFDPPGTCLPRRTGYAAEPGASTRSLRTMRDQEK